MHAQQTGLIINTTKTKVMFFNTSTHACITINNEPLEVVDDFVYLGSLISQDNVAQKDIQHRLGKGRSTYTTLRNIWKSNTFSLKTNHTLVKPVLLYGAECWQITKICRILWPNKISNKELHMKTGCRDVITEIKHRRLKWLGHVLQMPPEWIPKVALRWTPTGKKEERLNCWRWASCGARHS